MNFDNFGLELRHWFSVFLVLAALVILPLLRAFAPEERRRRILLVTVVLIHLALIPMAMLAAPNSVAARVFELMSSMCAAVAVVLMAGALLFSILLPRIHVRPPRILQDLVNVAAAVISTIAVATAHGVDLSSLIATSAVLTAV